MRNTVPQVKLYGTLLALLFLAVAPALSQSLDVFEPGSESRDAWLKARSTFHDVWFERADDLFSEIRLNDPDFALGFAYSAVIDSMLYRNAEKNSSRALALAVSAPKGEAQMTRALVAFSKGELEPAEEWLRKFLQAYPDDTYARHVLGFTLIDQKRPEEGVAELESVLEDAPSYYPAYNHLGYGLAALERREEALKAFRSFLDGSPMNPSAHDSVADGLHALGNRESAIAHLARSVLLEQRFAYGWRHLGDIYAKGGEEGLARRAYEMAITTAKQYGPDFMESVKKRINGLP